MLFGTYATCMVGVIFLSNATLEVWLLPWLSVATLIYPLSYLITTISVYRHGQVFASRVVGIGFLGAMLVSMSQGIGQVGISSLAAYLVSQSLELSLLVHLRTRKGLFWPLLASWIAMTADTIIFFTGAFWGKQLDWLPVAFTDYAVKLGLDWMWFWLLRGSVVAPAKQ